MKISRRALSVGSALLSSLTLVRLPDGPLLYLWMLKAAGAALAPRLALLSAGGALLGLLAGDRVATLAGLWGVFVATRHVALVAADHHGFAEAFGPAWLAQIPRAQRARMRTQRFAPLHPPSPPGPRQNDVVIATNRDTGHAVKADLWQPPPGVPRSGVGLIYLHGSGWHYLDKDKGTRGFFRHLAGLGHVVLDVGYTLAPATGLEGMMDEVKEAIAYLKGHAGDLHLDPTRIVLAGASAGAHLALLAAYTGNDLRWQPAGLVADTTVCGVVAYYGVSDLAAAHDALQRIPAAGPRTRRLLRRLGFPPPEQRFVDGRDVLVSLMGATPEAAPQRYWDGSPLAHVDPTCPPTLLLHGAHDFGVPPDQSRHLYAALRAAGVPAIYVELPETDHAFDIPTRNWNPAFSNALYDVERFLGVLSGERIAEAETHRR
jgi:acetyl esterase/lipase